MYALQLGRPCVFEEAPSQGLLQFGSFGRVGAHNKGFAKTVEQPQPPWSLTQLPATGDDSFHMVLSGYFQHHRQHAYAAAGAGASAGASSWEPMPMPMGSEGRSDQDEDAVRERKQHRPKLHGCSAPWRHGWSSARRA